MFKIVFEHNNTYVMILLKVYSDYDLRFVCVLKLV